MAGEPVTARSEYVTPLSQIALRAVFFFSNFFRAKFKLKTQHAETVRCEDPLIIVHKYSSNYRYKLMRLLLQLYQNSFN
jgi:hypothetical protein